MKRFFYLFHATAKMSKYFGTTQSSKPMPLIKL